MPKPKLSPEQTLTNYILDNMSENDVAWRKPYKAGASTIATPIRNTGEFYRGINNLILMTSAIIQNHTSPHYITFNQARTLGGSVRKGEKGTRIIKFGTVDKTNPATPEKEKLVPYTRKYSVFNISQIDNLPEEFVKTRTVSEPITHSIADLALALEVKVVTGCHSPAYYPDLDVIRLPNVSQYNSRHEFDGTFLHELAHSTAHHTRLDLPIDGDDTTPTYAFEELRAEICSVMLAGRLGIPTRLDERTIPYIKYWMKQMRADERYILKASAAAEKAATYIMEAYKAKANIDIAA